VNNMDDKTKEILIIMQEECAEVIQSISKIFRFGEKYKYDGTSNIDRLEEEIGDLICMLDIMFENGIISDNRVFGAKEAKRERLKLWSGIFK